MKRHNTIITSTIASTREPFRAFHIKFEDLAYWFWFFIGIESCFTFLFFKGNPVLGTFAGYLPPTLFTLLLLSNLLISKGIKSLDVLQPMAAKFLLALILWAGTTLLWTKASSIVSAGGYWGTMAIKVFVVLLLLCLGNVERVALKSLQGLVWGGLAFALVALILNPVTVDGRLGDEEFFHPNNIGNNLGIISLCAIYLAFKPGQQVLERRCYIGILTILLFTLLKSLSKTSIICFLLAALVYIICSKISVQKKINLLLLTGSAIAISSTALSKYLDRYLNDQQGGEALTTASGRTEIWQMTWDMIQENPIWGYGFQSYRDIVDQVIQLRLVHPHNELLNIWVNLGFVGLFLGLMTYICYYLLLRRAFKAGLPQAALGLALLIYSLIRGLTEANTPDPIVYPTALMMLMIGWLSQVNQLSFQTRK